MPLTNYAIDNAISQELSKLTQFNAPEVSSRYPQRKFWVSNFSLNSIFGGKVSEEGRVFSFFFLRRAEAAFAEYEYACEALNAFVATTPRSPSLYFRALHHFEIVISMMWQAYDFYRKVSGQDLFQKKDGSNYQRLNSIYNTFRHFAPSDLLAGNIHVIWLTNDMVKTETSKETSYVTYVEIGDFLIEIGNFSDQVSKAGK